MYNRTLSFPIPLVMCAFSRRPVGGVQKIPRGAFATHPHNNV